MYSNKNMPRVLTKIKKVIKLIKKLKKKTKKKKKKTNMGWPNHPIFANGGGRPPPFWPLRVWPKAGMGWPKLVWLMEYCGEGI
jgi:hypothetical protein